MPYDLGDTVRLTAESKDAGGTLTNAVSTVLTITLPDGTTATPSTTNPSTGNYQADYTTAQAGRHSVRWVFTTPNNAYTDAFDVRTATPPLILSLAEAKAHLNLDGTTANDEELRGWIESATGMIEWFVGPVARRTVVETQNMGPDGVYELSLRRSPAISLTSTAAVLSGGVSYAVADLDLDGPSGIVRRKDGGLIQGPLRVTYVAGRAIVPASISGACKIILQHMWRTQYGSSRGFSAIGGGEDFAVTEPVPGYGYAIPNRALQMIQSERSIPGVA